MPSFSQYLSTGTVSIHRYHAHKYPGISTRRSLDSIEIEFRMCMNKGYVPDCDDKWHI
jgi:hypothetical protein